MYGLRTESDFDAAHFLTDYHGKCENLHGHRWRVVAYLAQDELQHEGTMKDMVVDFAEFKKALRQLTEALDHSFVVEEGSLQQKTLDCLREEGFTLSIMPFRTTAENLAKYFYDQLAAQGLPVSQVDVYETPNNCAIYYGEGRHNS
ncbi:6-pyruvoyl trahydropterin synthase family protein [Adlercreutzia agrestimuris]|uniref:6-pyruvoyl trahydropterin synthase family protein n=1 Tax=Adlercreutzia agrestimuris TaxID=2941324 RepID=UPI0020409DB1|nr:6-carboxytetrahydropterin synthase [Adlercreutzia agrestimuris]